MNQQKFNWIRHIACAEFSFKVASEMYPNKYSAFARLVLFHCVILSTSQFVYIIGFMLLIIIISSIVPVDFFFLYFSISSYTFFINFRMISFLLDSFYFFFNAEIACIFSEYLIEKIQYSIFVSEAYTQI